MKYLFAGWINLMIVLTPLTWADGVTVGGQAPDFTLKDIYGRSHSLSDYRGKYVVLEWTNYECPFVKKHYNSFNMQELQRKLTAEGVVWLSINSSAPGKQGHFSPAEWQRLSHEKGVVATAILLDSDGRVGRAYGAKTTPHMFVIDPQGSVIYQGAIDSIPSTDTADIPIAKNYVVQALKEARAGEPVSQPSTQPYGCSVKY